jgi:hypothetical protein
MRVFLVHLDFIVLEDQWANSNIYIVQVNFLCLSDLLIFLTYSFSVITVLDYYGLSNL